MSNIKPSEKNTCAIIITRNPDKDFHARASRISAQVSQLIIVDNFSSEFAANMLHEISLLLNNCVLLLNPKNMGIATALNQGMLWAHQHDYLWAITFDQDTVVRDTMFEMIQNAYDDIVKRYKIAIIGSNHFDMNSGKYLLPMPFKNDRSWIEIKSIITSGSLISLEAYQRIGPFRDDFFIDLVDIEYCLRARTKGFKLFAILNPTMEHAIGRATAHKIAGIKLGTTNHLPERRYYMARNHMILAKEYLLRDPTWVISSLYSRFKSILLICLFENSKIKKIKLTLLGIIDGLFSKFDRNIK